MKSAHSSSCNTWAVRIVYPGMFAPPFSGAISLYPYSQKLKDKHRLTTSAATKCEVIDSTWPPSFVSIHSCGSMEIVSKNKLTVQTVSKNLLLLRSPCRHRASKMHA